MLWEPLCLFCPTAPIVKPSSRNRGIVRVFRPLRNPLGDGHQVTCDPRGDIDRPDGVLLRDHTVNVNSTTLRQQPTLWLTTTAHPLAVAPQDRSGPDPSTRSLSMWRPLSATSGRTPREIGASVRCSARSMARDHHRRMRAVGLLHCAAPGTAVSVLRVHPSDQNVAVPGAARFRCCRHR